MTDLFLGAAALIFALSPFAAAWVMVTRDRGAAGLAVAKEETARMERADFAYLRKRSEAQDETLNRLAESQKRTDDRVNRLEAAQNIRSSRQ